MSEDKAQRIKSLECEIKGLEEAPSVAKSIEDIVKKVKVNGDPMDNPDNEWALSGMNDSCCAII